jgi:hypothetical protein
MTTTRLWMLYLNTLSVPGLLIATMRSLLTGRDTAIGSLAMAMARRVRRIATKTKKTKKI